MAGCFGSRKRPKRFGPASRIWQAACGAPRERNWWSRVAEVHAALAKADPKFNDLLLKHPNFGVVLKLRNDSN